MAGDIIQVSYEQLENIAQRFEQQAEKHEALCSAFGSGSTRVNR